MSTNIFKRLRKKAKELTKGLVPTSYNLRGTSPLFLGQATVDPKCTRGVYLALKKRLKQGTVLA